MENDNKLENSSSLGTEILPTTRHLVLSSLVAKGMTLESIKAQKSDEISQDAPTYIQKSVEVVKSDCFYEKSTNVLRRTSFMKLFDPLHSIKQDVETDANSQDVFIKDGEEIGFLDENCSKNSPEGIINKTVSHFHTHDTLIWLESPKKTARLLTPKNLLSEKTETVKKYTEEDIRQHLKAQELRLQKEFSQKYSAREMTLQEKDRILSSELSKLNSVNISYNVMLSDVRVILESRKANNEKAETKLKDLLANNEKLKTDIKTTKEDLRVMKSALSDVTKWYEMSKSITKRYEGNEEHMTKNMQVAIDRQSSMNEMLQSRTKDLLDKATKEVESARKSAETQKMILEAQLKKSEIKIASLENDLEQARSSSDKLKSIYEDLKEKLR